MILRDLAKRIALRLPPVRRIHSTLANLRQENAELVRRQDDLSSEFAEMARHLQEAAAAAPPPKPWSGEDKDARDQFLHYEILGLARALQPDQPKISQHAVALACRLGESRDAYIQGALLANQLGDDDGAADIMDRAVARYGDVNDTVLYFVQGRAKARRGDIDGAATAFKTYYDKGGNPNDEICYFLGSCLATSGRLEEASEIFAQPRTFNLDNGGQTHTGIIDLGSERDQQEDRLEHLYNRRLRPPTPDPAFKTCDVVILIGCDVRYFDLFAASVVAAAQAKSGLNCGFHFHIVNPANDMPAKLAALAAHALVRHSSETLDLTMLTDEQRKTYFSIVRFLVLPQILAAYGKTVLVVDADQLIVRRIDSLMDEFKGHDTGLLIADHAKSNLLSWISASVGLHAPSPDGIAFARRVARYVAAKASDAATLVWHLDQAALACCTLTGPPSKLFRIPFKVMQSEIHQTGRSEPLKDATLFWSVTYSIADNAAKLDSALFRQLDMGPT